LLCPPQVTRFRIGNIAACSVSESKCNSGKCSPVMVIIASVITPEGVFIIGTYDENGVPNAMNAAWGMQSDEAV